MEIIVPLVLLWETSNFANSWKYRSLYWWIFRSLQECCIFNMSTISILSESCLLDHIVVVAGVSIESKSSGCRTDCYNQIVVATGLTLTTWNLQIRPTRHHHWIKHSWHHEDSTTQWNVWKYMQRLSSTSWNLTHSHPWKKWFEIWATNQL